MPIFAHHDTNTLPYSKVRATSHKSVHELLAARQSVQHFFGGTFKWIPFKDNAALWQTLCFLSNIRVFFFKHWYVLTRKCTRQWINVPASCERKIDHEFLTCVSSSIFCTKIACLIRYDLQALTNCTYFIHPPKYMQHWMSASNSPVS